MLIEITQNDIDQGEPGSHFYCPIALACHRLGYRNVIVSNKLQLTPGDYRILPETALMFICRFDCAMPVHPFSFEVADAT